MPSRNTILLRFLLPWTWGISSWLLQQSAATAPYLEGNLLTAAPPDLERGVAPLGPPAPAQPPFLNRTEAHQLQQTGFAAYFRLWKRLDKNQIRVILLFKFKMGLKVAETTGNINNTICPGTAKEHTVQWSFKKFRKGNRSLEDEESGDRIPKHRVLCSWKKQTYFLLTKTCWL